MHRIVVVMCATTGLWLAAVPVSAQGTSAASIVGVVSDESGSVLPGVTVEASSPALIERVRTAVTDSQGHYRFVELRPGAYTLTFGLTGFGSIRREGLDLSPNFTATVNIELKVGALEETITVSGQTPLVDTRNVTRQTVISKSLLDAVPTGKNLLSFYALTPAAVTPTNSQDVGGSKGETTARASVHGSKQGDTKMMLDGMSFNWFAGEGSGRTFYVNALTAQEVLVDVASGSSAEYTGSGAVINLIPKDGGNRFSGTGFVTGTNHNLQASNLTDDLVAQGVRTTSGSRSIYDVNAMIAGPIRQDRLWFMSSHRRWGRRERVANLFHDSNLADFQYTPDFDHPGDPAEDFRSDNIRTTWQAAARHKITAMYEWQHNNVPNNFSYLNAGVASMEAGNPYCYRNQFAMGTWTHPATNRFLIEGGLLFLDTAANTFEHSCAGVETGRLIKDSAYSFPYNGNGPLQTQTGQRPFKQRLSMSYVRATHTLKAGFSADESLHRETYTSRGETPFTYAFTAGVPSSLTQYASPVIGGEVEIRPGLGVFVQDQWSLRRATINMGLRYEYHRVYAAAIDTPAGPLVDARSLPRVDCLPCWHDINPRFGFAFDLFGDGKTALKASIGRYVSLASNGLGTTFNPQTAVVSSTTRSWKDDNGNYFPDCDLRSSGTNGECGPMANQSFGQLQIRTRPDESWITGWGNRGYNWMTSVSIDRELLPGIAVAAGYYHTTFGNFTVTDNQAVTPADYDPYCITAPTDSRLPANISGAQVCGLYDIKPGKFGQIDNVVTLADHFGKQTEVYNGGDVSFAARLPRNINLNGGWNVGNSISTLTGFPGATTSKTSACFVVDSPQQLYNCESHNPYQHRFKMSASVPLPWDLQAATVFQSLPGPNIAAMYTVASADVATSLGRPLAGNTRTVTIDLLPQLGEFLDERITQVDLRLSRLFRMGGRRLQANVDVYNLLNSSAVLWRNQTYGADWLTPTSILDARLLKFSLQYDF